MKFEMWGWVHILFLISPFIFIAITYFCFKNKSQKTKRIAGIVFSSIAVLLLLLRNLEILARSGWKLDPDIIPLQICHFANFVLLFAFIFNNKPLFALAFCFNLPAALMSIIFADSLVNYANILTARGIAYIFGHMLIVGITLYALIFKFVKINLKTVGITICVVIGLYFSSLLINNLFNIIMPEYTSNYFYSLFPEKGTPLEIFYKISPNIVWGKFVFNPVYLILTSLLGIVIVFAFYGLYLLLAKLLNKKHNDKILNI